MARHSSPENGSMLTFVRWVWLSALLVAVLGACILIFGVLSWALAPSLCAIVLGAVAWSNRERRPGVRVVAAVGAGLVGLLVGAYVGGLLVETLSGLTDLGRTLLSGASIDVGEAALGACLSALAFWLVFPSGLSNKRIEQTARR